MKVIHIPFCFHPDPVGGTEVYVESLARQLQQLGLDAVIAATGPTNASYTYNGLCVRRFQVSAGDLRQFYDEGDPHAAAEFDKIIEEEKPDLIHVHAFTRGVSVRLVRVAKQRGLPVVFTYHTPTASCQRGTLMRWGTQICDGKLDVRRCTSCTLHKLGVPRSAAVLLGSLPPRLGRQLGKYHLSGGVWTALRMTELIELHHASFRALMVEVDHVVAVCGWVRDVLILNNVPAEKITLCRHGIRLPAPEAVASAPESDAGRDGGLRIAFVGRFDPTKGIHVLVEALRRAPTLNVRLDIYAIVQSRSNERYRAKILALAASDPRIHFHNPLQSHKVVPTLRGHDVLAVPSQWLETGPLVVLEAFAAGIPVIGWNLGGLAETVRPGVDGVLIDPPDVAGWTRTFEQLATDRALLERLRKGVRPPRSMTHVAEETLKLYDAMTRRIPVPQVA